MSEAIPSEAELHARIKSEAEKAQDSAALQMITLAESLSDSSPWQSRTLCTLAVFRLKGFGEVGGQLLAVYGSECTLLMILAGPEKAHLEIV